MSTLGISFKNNKEQQELIRLINENNKPIVFCTGDAGTGKTFATLAAAIQLKLDRKYKRVIFGRNPKGLGEDMGYLPGDIAEKYGPYMGPLYDNLESIASITKDGWTEESLAKEVQTLPIAFIRGRTISNSIIIIDEAQNLNKIALQALITRVGNYSKIILLGSMNQIDDEKQRKKSKCDFQKVIEKLQDLPYVASIELTKSMRTEWCVEVDKLLREIE